MKRPIALALILALCLAIAAPALAQEEAVGAGNLGASVPAEGKPAAVPAVTDAESTAAQQDEALPPELAAAVQSLSPAQLKALVKLAQERLREMERERERERLRGEERAAEPKPKPEPKPQPKPKPGPKPKYEPFKGRVKLNGRELKFDQPPVVRDGRILVPLRAISEGLKAEVRWDPAAGTVTVIKGGTTVVLFLDKAEVLVNGQKVTLDAPAAVVNGRMLVPLRFLNQVFRNRVEFKKETGEVEIEEEKEEEEAGRQPAGGTGAAAPAQPGAGQEQAPAAAQ